MPSLNYWMPALRKYHKNYQWVNTKADTLYDAIITAVNHPPEQRLAIEALNLLYDYILIYGDWGRWVRLWYDALIGAQNLRDAPAQAALWREMGGLYVTFGNHRQGRAAFTIFLDRAKERNDVELVLSGYIGLIRLQTISQDDGFDDELVNAAIALAREIDKPELWAELYQSLAMAYLCRHETVQALAYGQTAYCYWFYLKDTVQKARTTFTLAQTCRIAEQFGQARRFLEVSRSLYAQTPSGARHAALDYEEAQLYLDEGHYTEAVKWLEYVNAEFTTLNQTYYRGAGLYSLGLAYAYLQEFDKAQNLFSDALQIWKELDNLYEQAQLHYGWAMMEQMRGDADQCKEYTDEGLRLCKQLPNTPARRKMETGIQGILEKMNKPPQ